jgi:signal transduction histidine kinase
MSPLGRFVRARLHRRIFMWFGATILMTVIVVGGIMIGLGSRSRTSWSRDVRGISSFTGETFARVWDDPRARDDLAESLARNIDLDLRLDDAGGNKLSQIGDMTCGLHAFTIPVEKEGARVGTVAICADRHHMTFMAPRVLIALAAACALLWGVSRKIAHRLSRPIVEVANAAEQIGAGNLATRVHIPHRRGGGEVDMLAKSINTMAERIEKQFQDQKALLAAVSHEIRTPLARVRLLLELLREKGVDEKELAEIDREAVEMDALVAELLASSRIEFSALSKAELDAADLARRALERAGEPADKIAVDGDAPKVFADPTLVARALANLVANATKHGGGLAALRVRATEDAVAFVAEDEGPGFAPGEEERAFEPFFRGANGKADGASLGLGLALVRRIAEAHGGRAWAEGRDPKGARVAIELPRRARGE